MAETFDEDSFWKEHGTALGGALGLAAMVGTLAALRLRRIHAESNEVQALEQIAELSDATAEKVSGNS